MYHSLYYMDLITNLNEIIKRIKWISVAPQFDRKFVIYYLYKLRFVYKICVS